MLWLRHTDLTEILEGIITHSLHPLHEIHVGHQLVEELPVGEETGE